MRLRWSAGSQGGGQSEAHAITKPRERQSTLLAGRPTSPQASYSRVRLRAELGAGLHSTLQDELIELETRPNRQEIRQIAPGRDG